MEQFAAERAPGERSVGGRPGLFIARGPISWIAVVAGLAAAQLAGAQGLPLDPPSAATKAANAASAAAAPWDDKRDLDFAARGFVATRSDPLIKAVDGHPVWNLDAYAFAKGPAPDTVNPSLWRHVQLLARHGLFKVAEHVWQVRGFDIANITFVEGAHGWIVIDTLSNVEAAQAAYTLVSSQLGKRPISAIIYTHSHIDHFGGAGAFRADLAPGAPILAPKGFLAAAISENVIAGPAMGRRASYQFGTGLQPGPAGTMGSGIGLGAGHGSASLLPPTREIDADGTELVLDGVRIQVQLTPGTEAPAEMNLGFPDWKLADLAENANVTQHNILTPRGAVIRNAKAWADGLSAALDRFAGAEVLITSHGWPRFGAAEIADYIGKHRDAYAFLHDQTVRWMNKGLTGDEIATRLRLPDALQKEWYDRPYYGSLSFNARAVVQYYLGWYDANPVHLQPLTPQDGGKRYVAALGGAERVRQLAQAAFDQGDYAWAAELLNRAVFADGTDKAARALLARSYQQLAWQSENSVWRNIYLSGAQELLSDAPGTSAVRDGGGLGAALSPAQLFDVLAVRFAAERAGDARLRLGFVFPDRKTSETVTVANGVLLHHAGIIGTPDATLTIAYADFAGALTKGEPLALKVLSGEARIDGNPAALQQLTGWIDRPDASFPIVLPRAESTAR